MNGSDESRMVAVILASAAAAHLAQRRLFDSLVPDRLDPFRREIEVTASCWQLAGAAALCVPRLRQAARWVNLPLHVGALMGAVDSWRHPNRFHGRRGRTPAVRSAVAAARIATHLLAIAVISWVTRSRAATSHPVAAAVQSAHRGQAAAAPDPVTGEAAATPDAVTGDANPDAAAPAEDR